MKRIFSATINSLRAIGYGFRNEAALREEMTFENGRITNASFNDYLVPRFRDVPEFDETNTTSPPGDFWRV